MPDSFNVFHQPKAFYMIFSLEFWERFGFYGVQVILAVYFVRKLGYSEAEADIVFGSFSALAYGFLVVGGKLGDSYLGTKRTMILGACTLAIGYFMLGLSQYQSAMFLYGLGAIAVGNGLFKSNPSSLLARCYEKDDPRLEGAFTMYYMAINSGAMISMLCIPWLTYHYGWSFGFYLCALGLVLCISSYLLMKSAVKDIGSKPDMQPFNPRRLSLCIVGSVIAIYVCRLLLQHVQVARMLLYAVGIIVLIIYFKEAGRLEKYGRAKMLVSLVLIFEAFLFFILYTQMPTSLNFFVLHNVNHSLLGFSISPESFQALNAAWIIIASPALALLYNYLEGKKRNFSMPVKFAVGMGLCSCGFMILPLAASTADTTGIVSSNWIILTYFFQSVGELLVSGLGLAMIAKLVPQRLSGFLMGAWFLSTSFAAMAGGYVASLSAPPASITNPLETIHLYSNIFMHIGIVTAVIAFLMFVSAPYLTRIISYSEK